MKSKRIYLSPPHMSEQEKRYLIDAYDSNWVAPLGPHVDGFEKEMSEYLNVKNAAALNSGTSALHLALRILDIKAGDKVLCPSLTFTASANAILYQKAEPIFIDSNPDDWVIDIIACEKAMKKQHWNIESSLQTRSGNDVIDRTAKIVTDNVAIGKHALQLNTEGHSNVGVGNMALNSNTTGQLNVAVGINALFTNQTGRFNVAVGESALLNSNTDRNTAVGYKSLINQTSGNNNTTFNRIILI